MAVLKKAKKVLEKETPVPVAKEKDRGEMTSAEKKAYDKKMYPEKHKYDKW